MSQVPTYLGVRRPRHRYIPAGATFHTDAAIVGTKRSDWIYSELVRAGGQRREFKMPVGISRRKKSCLVRFPESHDLSTGDVLHIVLETFLYAPAHDPKIANRLQFAERFYL